MYLGAASVARLADRLAYEDPKLFAAYNAAEKNSAELGRTFDTEMNAQDSGRSQEKTRVDPRRLDELAGIALIHDRVETKGEQTLSKQQQRAILLFPLSYVPITNCGHLDKVLDKRLLTEKIALSTVGRLIEVDLLLGLRGLTASRAAPVVCIQKASAPRTRRGPSARSAPDPRSWPRRRSTASGA